MIERTRRDFSDVLLDEVVDDLRDAVGRAEDPAVLEQGGP